MSKKITIAIRSHINIESIKDLLDSASRGAKYWTDSECLGYESKIALIFNHRAIEIEDLENNRKLYRLNLAGIKKGLTVMAKKEPRHFADFLKEDYDETTGDVFLQCCLFGEVIYG